VATFAGYALAREEGLDLAEARTASTFVLFGVGMWVLAIVARTAPSRHVLVGSMAAAFAVAVLTPGFREVFALEVPRPIVCMALVGIVATAGLLLETGLRLATTVRRRS
jgi:thiol:disulfide interchange protein